MTTVTSRPVGRVARDSDRIDEVVGGLEQFLDAEVISRHRERNDVLLDSGSMYGPDGRFRPEILELIGEVRQAAARAGYYTMFVPSEADADAPLGAEALYRVWHAIYRRCGAEYWLGHHVVAHWARGPSHLIAAAPPAVRERILPDLLSGRATVCFAMSEPNAGSDAWCMQTRAAQQPDGGWKLSGTKMWITNGPYAAHAIVFAVTDPEAAAARRGGVTAFLVPTDAPGFTVDRVIRLFGHAGGDEAIISLADVVVPADHLLGEQGDGFRLAMQGVSTGRLYNSARSVGMAEWALRRAVGYSCDRETFGKPLIDNQGIAFPLADSAVEVHAAYLMGVNCAQLIDSGVDARTELAMTKVFSTEAAVRVVDRAMQTYGALGFTNELALGEAWQQMRRICVADGSSEILRRQISRDLRARRQP